jgi:hypothetical protein
MICVKEFQLHVPLAHPFQLKGNSLSLSLSLSLSRCSMSRSIIWFLICNPLLISCRVLAALGWVSGVAACMQQQITKLPSVLQLQKQQPHARLHGCMACQGKSHQLQIMHHLKVMMQHAICVLPAIVDSPKF